MLILTGTNILDLVLDRRRGNIDRRRKFSVCSRFGRTCIIFAVDVSSSVPVDNKKEDNLVLDEGPTQELNDTKKYSITFTDKNKTIILSMHYNGANSFLFVNRTEIIKFKEKDSEIVANPLCLGNVSKDFSIDNMKKTGWNGYFYDFSVDYDAIAVDDI